MCVQEDQQGTTATQSYLLASCLVLSPKQCQRQHAAGLPDGQLQQPVPGGLVCGVLGAAQSPVGSHAQQEEAIRWSADNTNTMSSYHVNQCLSPEEPQVAASG